MSSLRRPPGPVRQLSLQQPPRRQQVRRQRSAEDDKPLQVFANPIRTRLQCQDGKADLDRPNVRVAWDENHDTVSNGVAVIARQIPGKLRPPTAKAKVTTRPIISEKASILYSRQELAERLRLAWKQREENRANIDIFLAQNAVESNCDSRPSSCATSAKSARRQLPATRMIISNEPVSEDDLKKPMIYLEKIETDVADAVTIPQDFTKAEEETLVNDENVDLRDVKSEQEEIDDIEKELRAEEDAVRDITLGDWPPSPSLTSKQDKKIEEDGDAKESVPNARTKRANFSNKVFTSGSVQVSNKLKESITVCNVDGKNRRTNSAPPQQRRQGSSSGRTQVSIVIDTPGVSQSQEIKTAEAIPAATNRTIKSAPLKRRTKSGKRRAGVGIGGNVGARGDGEEEVQNDGKSRRPGTKGRPALQTKVPDVVTMVSLVSSADSDSDIDQNSPRDDKLIHELRSKLPTTPIIKTSSCSPAIAVLRKPIKSVSFQQESFDGEKDETTAKEDRRWGVVGVFGQQRYPVVCRSGGSALPTAEEATSWKVEDTTSPAPFTSGRSIEANESDDLLLTPVTDREKRCLAVPIGDPIRDKKRRLLRTRSTPPRPYCQDERLNSPGSSPPVETNVQIQRPRDMHDNFHEKSTTNELPVHKADRTNLETEAGSEPEPEAGLTSSEPEFQTRKERECWHLYRRMCDKGVYVSFDTVLRGMLTPTEYRLRQKEAAPEC